MYCADCGKHIVDCDCPDIEERLARLAQSQHASIAALQNKAERDAKKKQIKPEDN